MITAPMPYSYLADFVFPPTKRKWWMPWRREKRDDLPLIQNIALDQDGDYEFLWFEVNSTSFYSLVNIVDPRTNTVLWEIGTPSGHHKFNKPLDTEDPRPAYLFERGSLIRVECWTSAREKHYVQVHLVCRKLVEEEIRP